MNRRFVTVAAALSLLLAACGSDESGCFSRDAELAAGVNYDCTAAPGSTVSVQVQLCPNCRATSASCQAEFIAGQLEIAPVFFECEESRDCPIGQACETNPATRQTTCVATIPIGTAPGEYDIVNAGTGTTVGDLVVSTGPSSCSFGISSAF